jgi:UDP-N-acetylglucosamine 2-epimerase
VGTGEEAIYRKYRELLEDRDAYDAMARASSPYGDGIASLRIADILWKGSPDALPSLDWKFGYTACG